jgi:hypothetical protein
MAVKISDHAFDAILLAELGIFVRDLCRIERAGAATHDVDDEALVFLVPDGNAVFSTGPSA